MNSANNRIYAAVIVKAINSNFNADFTSTPRTLPDGTVYATDKALKYAIKDYLSKRGEKNIFYIQRNDSKDLKPLTLEGTYDHLFPKAIENNKVQTLKNLLSCIDIRFFGATFARKKENISIHGPIQINHGVNRFPENEIYSEQIKSPFSSKDSADMTTIGNQTNLREGHYVYHLTVNPVNLAEHAGIAGVEGITNEDIDKLKHTLRFCVTALDTSRKIGSENEALIWIKMKSESKRHLPSFTELISIEKADGRNRIIDCTQLETVLNSVQSDIEKVEIWYNSINTELRGLSSFEKFNIFSGDKI